MTYQSWNIKDYLQKETDRESVDHCINGKCSGCGSCCTNFLAVTDQEINRSRAVTSVASQIIQLGDLSLRATKLRAEYNNGVALPELLEVKA